MSRGAGLWLWLVTAAAPPGPRDRRREEQAAHHRDALTAGTTSRQLALAAARGALDDLRWCRDERAHAGWPPLLMAPAGSTAIAAICMVATFLASLEGTWMGSARLQVVLPSIAAAVLVTSFADGFWRRRQPREREVDDPIFP